jgi:Leucine-rich repeat (LRR) protein
LELRGNKLTSLAGLNLPNLKKLFLAANEITSLEGIDQLKSLTLLHLRENQIQSLNGFSGCEHQHLTYINMRANNITELREMRKLGKLPKLNALVLAENPISEEDDYRLEILIALKNLDRLDKDIYLEEEKEEAARISEERKDDDEEEIPTVDESTAKEEKSDEDESKTPSSMEE